MSEAEYTPQQILEYLHERVLDLIAEREVLMAFLVGVAQTHPEPEKLKTLFDKHVEGMISRKLARPEFSDSQIEAMGVLQRTLLKAFDHPSPPSQ
ncbi:hypothetical protein [Pandoraea sp. SD6-2]|uniref:hypothetical protein n=1 Tax=Pandoraea sp. SD6-2 TaxID=1286093 RepID=UPI00032FDABB|nr:hypothetical protein [Pandoraea sp. SD6-2]EON13068.1 hypothetical protein C266_13689 [Pandoraea sp. SD6-2]